LCAARCSQHDLADEITPHAAEDQAALLEAMQEHQVTASGVRHPLEEPFFVLATQNPIEMEGTYPLPEAQWIASVQCGDGLPARGGRSGRWSRQTTAGRPSAIDALFTGEDVLRFHELVARCRSRKKWSVMRCSSRRHRGPHQTGTPAFVNEMGEAGARARVRGSS